MNKGFTLVEMLIVTAIIGLLTTFSLANYRKGGENLAQSRSIQSIAQAVRTAQNRSLASDCPTAPCRFGVHFIINDSKVYVFDDADLDNFYDVGEEVETVALDEKVFVTSISPAYTCLVSRSCADVLFVPPDPVATTTASISLPLTVGITGGRAINVNERGSIDVQ